MTKICCWYHASSYMSCELSHLIPESSISRIHMNREIIWNYPEKNVLNQETQWYKLWWSTLNHPWGFRRSPASSIQHQGRQPVPVDPRLWMEKFPRALRMMDLPRSVPTRERCSLEQGWVSQSPGLLRVPVFEIYWIHVWVDFILVLLLLFLSLLVSSLSVVLLLLFFYIRIYTLWLHMNIPYLHVSQNRSNVVWDTSTHGEC